MSPVDRLAPEGLYSLRHGPEGLLTGFRAVPNAIVEITRTTITAAAAAVKAVPSPHGAPVSAVIAAIMATWTAKLVGMLVHPLSHSVILSPPGRTGYVTHRLRRNRTRLPATSSRFLAPSSVLRPRNLEHAARIEDLSILETNYSGLAVP